MDGAGGSGAVCSVILALVRLMLHVRYSLEPRRHVLGNRTR